MDTLRIMSDIYYLEKENLEHLSYEKINHVIWKWMYNRVLNKMNKTLINPENIKKILFNKDRKKDFIIESVLPYVSIRNEEVWYTHDDGEDYYLPLNISFSDEEISYVIVLIEGNIDLRIINHDKNNPQFNHIPMLVILALKTLEECLTILLKELEL